MDEPEVAAFGSPSVRELLARLADADDAETIAIFAELVQRYEPVVRVGWRQTRGVEYQEFSNEVFKRALGALPTLREHFAFPAYFQRIVRSVSGDLMRRARKDGDIPKDADEVASAVENEILVPLVVRSYLEHLGSRERDVLELEYIYGYSADEMAVHFQVTPGTVRNMKHRALKKLQAVVERDRRMLERLEKK
jgi:RNA polymerase sigma factor (sigma-70 family)